jgi:hypothetical protein
LVVPDSTGRHSSAGPDRRARGRFVVVQHASELTGGVELGRARNAMHYVLEQQQLRSYEYSQITGSGGDNTKVIQDVWNPHHGSLPDPDCIQPRRLERLG